MKSIKGAVRSLAVMLLGISAEVLGGFCGNPPVIITGGVFTIIGFFRVIYACVGMKDRDERRCSDDKS